MGEKPRMAARRIAMATDPGIAHMYDGVGPRRTVSIFWEGDLVGYFSDKRGIICRVSKARGDKLGGLG